MNRLLMIDSFFSVYLQIIDKYVQATKGGWREPKLLNVWTVDREGEVRKYTVGKKSPLYLLVYTQLADNKESTFCGKIYIL